MSVCQVEEKLVLQISLMNGQLNSLSPTWLRDDDERQVVKEKRDILAAELKRHRTKGHDGKRCPSLEVRAKR